MSSGAPTMATSTLPAIRSAGVSATGALANVGIAAIQPSAGAVILWLPSELLVRAWPAFEWMAEQSWSVWHFPQLSTPVFIALCAGVLVLIVPGIWPMRLVGALLCLPALLNEPARPAVGEFELSLLDVGQGLSAVVRTHAHTLVYDAGPAFHAGRDAGELVVLPYLRHRGVRR